MIIDYKNELLHQFTAMKAIIFAYNQLKKRVRKRGATERGYYSPLAAVMSCIAGSHKLDYMRLLGDEQTCYSKISSLYHPLFSGIKPVRQAVCRYQSASREEMIDGLKPYQMINGLLQGNLLKDSVKKQAGKWVALLETAFSRTADECGLQPGQRIFRGLSLTKMQFDRCILALENKTPLVEKGFYSTSLSECIALSFAVFSDSKRFEHIDNESSEPHFPVVLELTNRRESLPFLLPDALRVPQNNQGQMEILLPAGIALQPTWIDPDRSYVKIYAEIVA